MTDLIAAADAGLPGTGFYIPITNADGSAGWEKVSIANMAKAVGLFPLLPPPAFPTWVNQGGASLTTEADGTLTVHSALDVADNVRGIFKALPATPWAYKIGFIPNLSAVNFQNCGIALRDSVSGKMVCFGVYRDTDGGGSGPLWYIANYTNPTTKSGNVLIPVRERGNGPFYLRLADNGANRTAGFGYNRYTQELANYNVASNSFLVPDQIGIYTNNFNATIPLSLSVFSWE